MGTIAHRCRSRRGMTPRNGETYGQQRIRSTTPFAPPTTPTAPNLPRHEGHATHIDETSARQLREVVRARSQCQAPEPSCSRRARLAQRRVVARKAWRQAGTGQRHLHTQSCRETVVVAASAVAWNHLETARLVFFNNYLLKSAQSSASSDEKVLPIFFALFCKYKLFIAAYISIEFFSKLSKFVILSARKSIASAPLTE